jgi:hypothetical protein
VSLRGVAEGDAEQARQAAAQEEGAHLPGPGQRVVMAVRRRGTVALTKRRVFFLKKKTRTGRVPRDAVFEKKFIFVKEVRVSVGETKWFCLKDD